MMLAGVIAFSVVVPQPTIARLNSALMMSQDAFDSLLTAARAAPPLRGYFEVKHIPRVGGLLDSGLHRLGQVCP
jgi:hypothetical protein